MRRKYPTSPWPRSAFSTKKVSSNRARSFTSPWMPRMRMRPRIGRGCGHGCGGRIGIGCGHGCGCRRGCRCGWAAAVVEAAAERGVCLGVDADPGAKRQLPSLKSAIVGAGEIFSDPALSLLSAVNAVRYGTLDRARVTETVSWSGRRRVSGARFQITLYGILAAGA